MDISNKSEISPDIIFMQIKEADQDWFKQFGKLWKTEEFNFWISSYKDPIANGITKFEVSSEDELIKNIELIISCAKKNHVPFSWSVDKNKFPQGFSDLLENKGFSREESDVMINFLHDIDKIKIPELCIKRIKESEIEQWLNVFNTAFDGEYDVNFTKAYFQLIQKNLVSENSKTEYYEAYVGSKIVSIGTIFLYPTYGLIANIATDPEYRNKGMATYMTASLCKRAKLLGLNYVLLTTSNASAIKVYKKVGFKKIMTIDDYTFGDENFY